MSRITRLLMCLAFVALVAMIVLAYVNRGRSPERLLQPGQSTGRHKKDYDKAIADYNEAIRLDPMYAPAYNNRGNAWREQERLRQGDRRLQRGDPARSGVRTRLQQPGHLSGGTRRSTTRPSLTTTRPSGSIPRMLPPTATGAMPGSDNKNYDKAIADYNEAIRLDSKYALAYNGRGNIWSG